MTYENSSYDPFEDFYVLARLIWPNGSRDNIGKVDKIRDFGDNFSNTVLSSIIIFLPYPWLC